MFQSQASSVRSPGLFIDEKLSWQPLIDKLSKKIASGISAMKRMRPFTPLPILNYMCYALIQLHFDYCNPVY